MRHSLLGRALRATLIRPGRSWRVPLGLRRGLRLEVDPAAPLNLYIGTSELELARHVRALARPGVCCFDVGGYDGGDALALARLTGAEVVTFEFDRAAVARIRRNLARNPFVSGRVRIVQTFVAHERGAAPRTDTLDGLVASGLAPNPGLIKVDVEGAEAGVLSGAGALLRAARPHLIVETHSLQLELECIALLGECGYEPEIVQRRRRLRERRGGVHNRWLVARGAAPDGRC